MLFLFSVVVLFPLKAEDVKKADVKKVAINAFSYYSGKASHEFKVVQEIPVLHRDTALLYVYNFEKGFVIVAADNVSEPVLGFGLDSKFDFEDMPPALQFLLESYQEEILYAKRQNVRTNQEISAKWSDYLSSTLPKTLYTPATYLITTIWDQEGVGATYTTTPYNCYCPKIGTTPTLVGCGGVALAQILNFWSCNVHPQGTATCNNPNGGILTVNFANQTYSWGSMLPNQANTSNALLLYHCAVALQSKFETSANGGTASYPEDVPY